MEPERAVSSSSTNANAVAASDVHQFVAEDGALKLGSRARKPAGRAIVDAKMPNVEGPPGVLRSMYRETPAGASVVRPPCPEPDGAAVPPESDETQTTDGKPRQPDDDSGSDDRQRDVDRFETSMRARCRREGLPRLLPRMARRRGRDGGRVELAPRLRPRHQHNQPQHRLKRRQRRRGLVRTEAARRDRDVAISPA